MHTVAVDEASPGLLCAGAPSERGRRRWSNTLLAVSVAATMTRRAGEHQGRTGSVRWRTAVLVTVLSIGFAEVSVASNPWGLVYPLGWLWLVPVYGVQVLLLATIVLRANRRPTLAALWSAGAVLGLYEFYITQVLWDNPEDPAIHTGLVEWFTLIVLVGFWHSFVATVLPIMITEQVMAREPTLAGLLPKRIRALTPQGRWYLVVLGAVGAGAFYGSGVRWWTAAALGVSIVVMWAVVVWARRAGPVEDFVDALPRRWGTVSLVLVVTVMYGLAVWRANASSPVSGARQLVALGFYVLMIGLTWRNLRHSRTTPVTRLSWVSGGWRPALVFVLIASGVALVPALGLPLRLVLLFVPAAGVALTMGAIALWGAVKKVAPSSA